MKTCKECGVEKELSEFYKNKHMESGYFSKCKKCTLRENAKYRANHIDERRAFERKRNKRLHESGYKGKHRKIFKLNNPLAVKAHAIVRCAIGTGKIFKPKNCSTCNKETVLHGHHHDYTKPLDVIWLCPPCHSQLHQKLKEDKCTQSI